MISCSHIANIFNDLAAVVLDLAHLVLQPLLEVTKRETRMTNCIQQQEDDINKKRASNQRTKLRKRYRERERERERERTGNKKGA